MTDRAAVTLVSLAIAGAFVAGNWYGGRADDDLRAAEVAPPAAHAGHAPSGADESTSMRAKSSAHESHGSTGHLDDPPPTAVRVTPAQQQLLGLGVQPVEQRGETHVLRLFGQVAPDETRVYRLQAGVDGFIREASTVTTGSQVAKNQWLATFSAPDSRAQIQAYLVTLEVLDRAREHGQGTTAALRQAAASSQLAIDRLLNLGMSAAQIAEIARTRQAPVDLRILAPGAGFVLARNVAVGQTFERGAEWYQIADLRRIWILVDVFEHEAPYVRPGMQALVSLPGAGERIPARISEVLPQFDAEARALKVRLEADNPQFALRPAMFVDVELPITRPPAITVPTDAVVDTGLRQTVFVDRGAGRFEPRAVQTGWRFGERVEILTGLSAGERIVTSSTFLIDSESQLQRTASAHAHHGHGEAAPAGDAAGVDAHAHHHHQ